MDLSTEALLRSAIRSACKRMPEHIRVSAILHSFPMRLQACVDADGERFEHSL